MDEVLHANIFFFIASVATVVFCFLVCIILYHVIKILKTVRSILDRIEAGSEIIAEDMAQLRSFVADGIFSRLMGFFTSAGSRPRATRKRRTTTEITKHEEEDN